MQLIVNGVRIQYDTYGPRTGLPIVLIHGFPFSSAMWQPQVAALQNQHFVITYDVRGHGASEVGDGQYSVEYFVDDLIALLDHLHLRSVVAAGLSMGGYIVLRAVERHPDRFRALVLCDTRSEADNNEGRIKRAQQAKSIKTDGMKKFAESFLQAVFHEKTFHTKPGVVEQIRSIIERTSPIGAAGTLLALAARTDTTSSLFNINVPTLIMVGQHDKLTPPSASYAMKDKIRDAAIHVLRDSAHMSNLENPEEFNKHLTTFLQKLR